MQRILIIRFSSIGDIVLTTPVVRVLRTAYPKADIRFVTKPQYAALVENSPHLNGVFQLNGKLSDLAKELKAFDPELVIDLHHNLRTRILRILVGGRWRSFNKLNMEKWLKVNLKIDRLPDVHIVDRYFETLKPLGLASDGKGLEFHFPESFVPPSVPKGFENGYVAVVVGAKYATKRLPKDKLVAICNGLSVPVVLIGGPEDEELAKQLEAETTATVWNTCGLFDLAGSAWLVKQSAVVITHDTGMMHIAAAFNKKIVSIWGNTIPAFGMYPYMPEAPDNYYIAEVDSLDCRPCSKIGYAQCPKGHFKCMELQDVNIIISKTDQYLNK